jgi:hypothetical protein
VKNLGEATFHASLEETLNLSFWDLDFGCGFGEYLLFAKSAPKEYPEIETYHRGQILFMLYAFRRSCGGLALR